MKTHMELCRTAIQSEINTDLEDNNISEEDLKRDLVARAHEMIKKAYKYFKKTIYCPTKESKLATDMNLYSVCRYVDPIAFRSLNNGSWNKFKELFNKVWNIQGENNSKKVESIFTNKDMEEMEKEWHNYQAAANMIEPNENDYNPKYRMSIAMKFWRNSSINATPNITKFARYVFLIAASSAAAERVFSTLKNSLSLVQLQNCIEEYSEISIMLQYNKLYSCDDVD